MLARDGNSEYIEYFEHSHKHGFIKIVVADMLLLIIGYEFKYDKVIGIETFFNHQWEDFIEQVILVIE